MFKSYKYRIYPTEDQKKKIDHSISVCRLVYNLGLEIKIRSYREHQKSVSGITLGYQLPELRKAFPWIKEVDSQALYASIRRLDAAFKNMHHGAGFPKFKSKRKSVQSFQCPHNKREVNWDMGTVSIPNIYNIPARLSRRFEGQIKTCTISRTPTGKYFISVLVDNKLDIPKKPSIVEETTIGIDVGIKSFVVTSDGRSFEPNRKLKENLKRLKALQGRASKKQKGSKNRKKANLCVAILHEKIKNRRSDYIHQVTNALIHDNQVESIVIEDLNVSGLLANHKLAQAISDVSFAEFFRVLKYKCEWHGKNLITIGRFDPSSKRCNSCGEINKNLTLGDREWECETCRAVHDRDENAAINIKWYGLQQTIFKENSGEGISEEPVESSLLGGAMKQEYVLAE